VVTCRICGRKFKSEQALGGHVSHAHRATPNKSVETSRENSNHEMAEIKVEESDTDIEESDNGEEISTGEEIRDYISKGYGYEHLTKNFGFSPRSVRREMEKFILPDQGPPEQDKGKETMPAVYKKDERAKPEVLLRDCIDGSLEDEWELRGMMKLRAAILLAGELTNIATAAIKPVLEMMKETRLEQDAAAARAKESSIEVAERAAVQGANLLAERVIPEVQALMEKQRPAPAGATVHERMFGPLADMMGQQMKNMFGGMFGMGGGQAQPGQSPQMTDEERKAIFGGGT